jgi:tetratricopeptide (TPR) repeat protein
VIGWDYAQLGDYQRALACCGQALRLLQDLDDRHGEAVTWDSLGYARHHLGQYAQAIACYQRSLERNAGTGADYLDAITLDHLGDAYEAIGDTAAARSAWQRAAAILDQYDRPADDPLRAKLTRLGPPVPPAPPAGTADDLPTASGG